MKPVLARLKVFLSVGVRYAVGALIIYWLVRTEVLDFAPLASISIELFAEGLTLSLAIVALTALRVQYLLRDQGMYLSFRRCYAYNCIGLFYSLFLPGGLSGDAARAFYFFQDIPHKRIALLGALLLDRFLGLITMIGMGIVSGLLLAFVIPWIIPYLAGFSALFVVLVIGLVVAIRYEIGHRQTPGAHRLLRLWERVRGMFSRLHLTEYSARTVLISVGLSALMNVLAIILIYLCSVLNGAHLDFLKVSAATPLGLLTNAVPLSPGGLGVGEKAFDVLYRALGGDNGAGSFLAARIFLYSPALIGALFAAFYLFKLRRSPRFGSPEASD
jgi:uncharacterized protein (TIRG00374 family)